VEILTDSDYRALARFRFEIRRFVQFSEEAARVHGLEPQQHQTLLALKGLPEDEAPTMRALAARLMLKHHSVVGLVDRLEKAGLVIRLSDPEDARRVVLRLTRRGEETLRRLSLIHREELQVSGPRLLHALRSIVSARVKEAELA
jgi:DNA-binding MarR family transcriptional regulator